MGNTLYQVSDFLLFISITIIYSNRPQTVSVYVKVLRRAPPTFSPGQAGHSRAVDVKT